MAYVPQADEPEEVIGAGARAAPVGAGAALNHPQRHRFLRAGGILAAAGWLVLTYTTTGGDRDANAEHVLAGLALLLLGAFLIMLSPVASRFPGAARAGAAVADAVLSYLFAPAGN
ncbi:hypothetical protein GQ55_4G049300 [Panicum hallii var. hallii]|uniref:Uncharacterized protein n=1 Tax=Panicum hallii var. hallii TaxID=1504633 RepID=A0A2T7DVC5_9POAL|nr:hypothetical protein GQ55_4G049300 [Panicum hallii var. hallii]